MTTHPLLRKIDCPHCGNPFKTIPVVHNLGADARGQWRAHNFTCPSCDNFVIYLIAFGSGQDPKATPYQEISYPKYSYVSVAPEIPSNLEKEFREAANVLSISPKSGAALSRRLLQAIFHHHIGIKKTDLYKEIDSFIEDRKPPSHIADVLHQVREFGNNAAHPRANLVTGEVIEVEPGEAEFTLQAVTYMFDFVFVQPAKALAMKSQLNEKLVAAGKPTLK